MQWTPEQLAAASRAILDPDNSPELAELKKAVNVEIGSDLKAICMVEILKAFPDASTQQIKDVSEKITERYIKNAGF